VCLEFAIPIFTNRFVAILVVSAGGKIHQKWK